jgi:hypothetical protein
MDETLILHTKEDLSTGAVSERQLQWAVEIRDTVATLYCPPFHSGYACYPYVDHPGRFRLRMSGRRRD